MHGIAVLPQGLEIKGAEELKDLGAQNIHPLKRGVSFTADTRCFYRLHLQARLPFRFLREMARFECNGQAKLYQAIQNSLDWERWLHPSMTFRVNVSGKTRELNHSHFTALNIKNALVDLQREIWGKRSSIDLEEPNLGIHVHLKDQEVILSFEGSAKSLHKRGYRSAMGDAPIKENLAAGLIKLSEWNEEIPLIDPMCGSGTLLVEAASMALNLAPGINRQFLLEGWADFDSKLWNLEKEEAINSMKFKKLLPQIIGCEKNDEIANQAKVNVKNSGLEDFIKIKQCHFLDLELPMTKGLIVCNPPYGYRIGSHEDLKVLYKQLRIFLKDKASGWELWVLSGNKALSQSLGLKCSKKIPINNGGIDCRWLQYLIH